MKIPNWDVAVSAVRDSLRRNPNLSLKAREYGSIYRGKRGLMVVDVVASRKRRYDTDVVPRILPLYESKASNLSLLSLSSKSPK